MKRTSIASLVALLLAALLGGCATGPDGYYYDRDYGYYSYNRDRDDAYWRRHAYRDDTYYYPRYGYPRYGPYYQDREHGS